MASQYSRSYGGADSFRILILGETGAGKTRLTERITRALARASNPESITVIDLAPDYMGVGRPLEAPPGTRILRPHGLKAPRLQSHGNCSLAWRLAEDNAFLTTKVLREFISRPTPILVINDMSIHLHAGDPGIVLDAFKEAAVVAANSYYGDKLRDECGIWEKERRLIEKIIEVVDIVWRI